MATMIVIVIPSSTLSSLKRGEKEELIDNDGQLICLRHQLLPSFSPPPHDFIVIVTAMFIDTVMATIIVMVIAIFLIIIFAGEASWQWRATYLTPTPTSAIK